MRPGTKPHLVSPLLTYHPGTISNINAGSVIRGAPVCAGVTKDGSLAWITRGPVVEVVDTRTRNCLASWTFGAILKDTHTSVACVAEYKTSQTWRLLIGVNNSSDNGMLCSLDVGLSKVVKAVEIPHKVTFVEPVTTVGGDYVPMWALNEQLRQFYGIVAVGTEGGLVYLIDMCVDEEMDYSDEVMPNRLQIVSPRSRDVQQRRMQAASKGKQLCMVLDEEAQCQGEYQYRRCDGTVLKLFNIDDVKVTCIKYVPQTGNLVVGFNFGCFQLWKLHVPVLEYSSRLEVDAASVTHIAYQEPENDPKNFCYLWMARDPSEQRDEGVSTASLYQLAYNKKTWYSNYGAFYEELTSVSLRYELELTSTPLTVGNKSTVSSRLVSCYTLEDPNYSAPARLGDDESFEESVHGPDLSLCVIVWETSVGQSTCDTCHLCVFDMNRWYHAQMPPTIRNIGSTMDTCPYLACLSLEDAADTAAPDSIIAVHIGMDSLRKFTNNSPMPPEQHFYPSSLAFDALMVTESGFVKASYLGTQRQVLASMNKMGPSILLNPKELYSLSMYMGLLPQRSLDTATYTQSVQQMREQLLSLALDYNMISFIIKCVQQWAAGEYVHVGCTLKFLLDWAWDKVGMVKNSIDTTCTPLYDWSGMILDQRSVRTLYQCHQKLEYLTCIFKVLLHQAAPTTEQGFMDLQNKLCALTFITQHLQMVLWFVKTGLLPEHDDADDVSDQKYSYPASDLIHAYRTKRQELHRIHSDLDDPDLLMIDGLLSHMGAAVSNVWNREGGDGLYPPPSLHALLSIYLLDDINLQAKHSVVLYVLLDLVSLMDPSRHQQFVNKISKFAKSFAVPQSQVKQVEGCWLLDHGDFEEAMSALLDPMVQEEMGRWQHSRIIRALLYQENSKMALRYLSTAQPALTSPRDVKLKLTVLLASGLTAEALEYQRTYRDHASMHDLLHHLFLGCQQMKTMDQLLQLPLTNEEERHLVEYLTESSEPHSQEVLVLHYLQRARYVEAIQLNEKLKQSVPTETSSKARERVAARNAIVDGFMSILSGVQRKLIFEKQNIPTKISAQTREVRKPKPLSTTVTQSRRARVVSQASLFLEVADKVKEVRPTEEASTTDCEESVGPFVCTPITPKPHSRLSLSQPVTYPEITDNQSSGMKPSPWRSAILTPFSSTKTTPVLSRRKSKMFGAEVLTMLETPKVRKRTPVKKQPTLSAQATPQSILKVKKFLVRSPSAQLSPSQTAVEDLGQPGTPKPIAKKLGFNNSSLPGTPRTVSFIDSPRETPAAPTPKHLRFSGVKEQTLPQGRRSPISPPSPRSLKDRSPTPESISRSPKNYARTDDLRRPPLHTYTGEPDPRVAHMDVGEDEDITFKLYTDVTGSVEEMDASTETLLTPCPQVTEEVVALPTPPSQVSGEVTPPSPERPAPFTQLKDITHDSPLRLRQSPLIKTMPRSPTVKLSKSPMRGKYTPKYKQYDEPGKSEQPVKDTSSTVNESPIEIDLTEDEDMVLDDDVQSISMEERVSSASQIISGSVSPSLKTDKLGASDIDFVRLPSERVHTDEPLCRVSSLAEADSSNMDMTESVAHVGQIQHVSFSTELVPSEEIAGMYDLQDVCSSSSVMDVNRQDDNCPEAEPGVMGTSVEEITDAPSYEKLEIIIPEPGSEPSPSPRKSPRLALKGVEQASPSSMQPTSRSRTPSASPKQRQAPSSRTPSGSPKRPQTPLSRTPSTSPKRPQKPQSRTPSASPKRSQTPLSRTPSASPKRPQTSRSTSPKQLLKEHCDAVDVEVDVTEPGVSSPPSSPRDDGGEISPHAVSPRIPPTPPESGQDSPQRPQATIRHTKPCTPPCTSVTTSLLTPTRQSSRLHKLHGVSEIQIQSDDVHVEPVTPTRRSSRLHSKGSAAPADVGAHESGTPSRHGRTKTQLNTSANATQEPTTPTRHGRSQAHVASDIAQEPTTPTRRGLRGAQISTDVTCKSSVSTLQEPTTPTRRIVGRPKGDNSRVGVDISDNAQEEPTTPTRRGRGRPKGDKSPGGVVISDTAQEEPTTPTRRGRGRPKGDKSPGAFDITKPAQEEPTTPTRRGRGRPKGDKSPGAFDITEPAQEEPTTPTRRGRGRPKGDKSPGGFDITEPAQEEPMTPTRQGRGRPKGDTSVQVENETVMMSSTAHTKTEEPVEESLHFTFSDPVAMDVVPDETMKPLTPLKSFIFSPPIMRSPDPHGQQSRKRSSRQLELKAEAMCMDSILLPPVLESAPAPTTVPIKKERKAPRKTKTKSIADEETIVLISPVMEGVSQPARQMVTRQRAKDGSVATKTLRGSDPSKVSRLRAKKKPVKL